MRHEVKRRSDDLSRTHVCSDPWIRAVGASCAAACVQHWLRCCRCSLCPAKRDARLQPVTAPVETDVPSVVSLCACNAFTSHSAVPRTRSEMIYGSFAQVRLSSTRPHGLACFRGPLRVLGSDRHSLREQLRTELGSRLVLRWQQTSHSTRLVSRPMPWALCPRMGCAELWACERLRVDTRVREDSVESRTRSLAGGSHAKRSAATSNARLTRSTVRRSSMLWHSQWLTSVSIDHIHTHRRVSVA